MSEIVPFVFDHDREQTEIRTLVLNGEPWFVAVDVCRALGLENTTGALRVLDADETTLITNKGSPGPGLNIVSEPGLYSLISVSRKPAAKVFKRWVNHEVLPALRKTGKYELPMTAAGPQQPDLLEAITDVSAQMREGFGRMERILGYGRHRFTAEQVRYVSIGHAKHNGCECWYCNDAVIVDQYGRRLDGKSEVHHANGNKADRRTENCMLACIQNECHDRLTYPNRPDHIPADKAIARADTFHERLRQKNAQIRAPSAPAATWPFLPMKQTNMGFPIILPPRMRKP